MTSNTLANSSQTTTFNNMMQELSICGYHRARVHKVSQFNRLAGGFIWALSKFPEEDDNETFVFVESEDNEVEKRRCDAMYITKALEDLGCPHTITVNLFMKFQLVDLSVPLTWLLRKMIGQGVNKNNYTFSLDLFDRYCSADFFIKNFHDDPTFCNETLVAEHCDLFDNAILFNVDLSVQGILAEYFNYSQTGHRVNPGHLKRDNEDFGKANLVSTLFGDFKYDNAKNIYEKVCDLIEKLGAGKKIGAYIERFVKEAVEYYEMNEKYYTLKNEYDFKKVDLTMGPYETVCGPVPSLSTIHEGICRSVSLLLERLSKVHDETALDLADARHEEKQAHLEYCINGNPKGCPSKRKLLDEETEHREAVEKKFNLVEKTKNDVARCFEKFKSDNEALIRQMGVEEPMEPLTNVAVDQRLPDDVSRLASLSSKCILDLQDLLPNQEHGSKYVDAAVAYVSDVRNLMTKWFFKADMMVTKRTLLEKDMKVMRQQLKKAKRVAVLASTECDSMNHLNVAIQKGGYLLAYTMKTEEN